VGAAPSSNQQEMHLYALSTNGADPGDSYKFFLHFMPKVNGVTTVAIENVFYPGYYISASPPGFNYAQTQVTLTKHSNPDNAPKWQCR